MVCAGVYTYFPSVCVVSLTATGRALCRLATLDPAGWRASYRLCCDVNVWTRVYVMFFLVLSASRTSPQELVYCLFLGSEVVWHLMPCGRKDSCPTCLSQPAGAASFPAVGAAIAIVSCHR